MRVLGVEGHARDARRFQRHRAGQEHLRGLRSEQHDSKPQPITGPRPRPHSAVVPRRAETMPPTPFSRHVADRDGVTSAAALAPGAPNGASGHRAVIALGHVLLRLRRRRAGRGRVSRAVDGRRCCQPSQGVDVLAQAESSVAAQLQPGAGAFADVALRTRRNLRARGSRPAWTGPSPTSRGVPDGGELGPVGAASTRPGTGGQSISRGQRPSAGADAARGHRRPCRTSPGPDSSQPGERSEHQ
jgi:hypothetical protein